MSFSFSAKEAVENENFVLHVQILLTFYLLHLLCIDFKLISEDYDKTLFCENKLDSAAKTLNS